MAKKLLLIILAILCITLASSCSISEIFNAHEYSEKWSYDETNHWKSCKDDGCDEKTAVAEHSFGEPVITEPKDGKDGSKVYTCKVCSKTKTEVIPAPAHTHTASDEWISDSNKHWNTCEVNNCDEKLNESNHVWDNGTVVTEAISGVAGSMRYVCLVCQHTKTDTIPALPDKMSEDAWFEIFLIENVRIDCVGSIGDYGSTSVVIYIDGELAEVMSEEMTYYSDSASELAAIDFSFNYDDFNHLGEGVYYANSVVIVDEESEMEITDVTLTVSGGIIESVSYSMELFGMVYDLEYSFSEWGEVTVEFPELSEAEYLAALDYDNFKNYTFDVYSYDENYELNGATYYFDGNNCYYIIYNGNSDYEENNETIENAGVVMNEYIAMLEQLSAEDFEYDVLTGMYTYCKVTDDGKYYLSILIEDGVIVSIVEIAIDGTVCYCDFYDYGVTTIE